MLTAQLLPSRMGSRPEDENVCSPHPSPALILSWFSEVMLAFKNSLNPGLGAQGSDWMLDYIKHMQKLMLEWY